VRRVRALGGLVVLSLAGQAHVTAPRRAATYTVQKGDTLARVATRTGVAAESIARANGIKDLNRIYAGKVLTIPPAGEPAPAAPAPLPPPLPATVVVMGGGRTHQVATGQTLGTIARSYGTTVAELVQLNGLKNPNLIREGVQLQVPGPTWLCPVAGAHQFADSWGQPWHEGRRHEGTDVFAFRGTPVVANVGGTVQRVSGARAGQAYYLRGDDGNTYYGAHLDAVTASGRVEQGGRIGTVGSTGNAEGTTPHLHFEIKPGGGAPVNPFPTLQQWC
jgi:murein DD-endopeptidase MepM/ murein hydrolase activator NlpD